MKTNCYFICITLAVTIVSCVSAESPTLVECRALQENIARRISQSDSALNAQLSLLRYERDALSTDTLLATDSIMRKKYTTMKEDVSTLEFQQSELHRWRDGLILLPSTEAALKAYSDTLVQLEGTISEIIRTTSHERTSETQPQE
jgi:hypothetical protein